MKALMVRELQEDREQFEGMIQAHQELMVSQLQDLRIEAAFATQTAILRLEGALTYVTKNIERLEDEAKAREQAKKTEEQAKAAKKSKVARNPSPSEARDAKTSS